jgi:CHAP domain
MPAPVNDLVEIPEEIHEVTQEEAEKDHHLLADPEKAKEGVLDDEDPAEFEARELEAAEEVILAEGGEDEGGGGPPSISTHQRRALALAVSQKGMREHPRGSNDNKYSRYFDFGPQFWCADFVAFCLDMTGDRDRKVPWGYPSAVKNITAWGQRNGKIHSQPQKGDIFTRKDGMHTGLVLSAQGSSFTTIEGNTSGPGGDFYVASHQRDAASGMYFFVRDDFAEA